ncbi:hypothetical protein CRE_12294 [Caenorhabditis remanei]|uniref:DUF7741 domain-containing protein n=1 Tax=Caenorhabditis remanei TaxID=31234 RepID=E3NEP6_CAERE|nr:hypothetical protein CRE_12294 [Caenorhabditis remanei]
MTFLLCILLIFGVINGGADAAVICYECHANSTEQGKYCSIDKLCEGTSCYFQLNKDNSWSAGCSTIQSVNTNVTCSSSSSSSSTVSSSCSCNSDFCNSLARSKEALVTRSGGRGNGWWGGGRGIEEKSSNITLTLPDRNFVHCEECGSVTVGSQTIQIPCDHNHTCQGNYCVAVRGQSPFSYCGGVWDVEKAPGCYFDENALESCLCSMNMCNALLEPAPIWTTTALSDPTLATLVPIALGEENPPTPAIVIPEPTTVKPTTKRKCKNAKLSPNDQAVFMGEKLKNVIMGGFGSDDGAVQNFEDDINAHICNYSEDE